MAKLLGNPEIFGQGGGHMAIHPGIIPGYLDKAGKGAYGCPSQDTSSRGAYDCPS